MFDPNKRTKKDDYKKIVLKKEDSKAETEEILNRISITIHEKHIKNPNKKSYESKIPKKVATPLPPLKNKNIGYKCPRKHTNPNKSESEGSTNNIES